MPLFSIKSLSHVVPPVLHINLGIVLKLLPSFTFQNSRKKHWDKNWDKHSQSRSGRKVGVRESKTFRKGSWASTFWLCLYIDFENLKDHFEARLSKYWSKLDDIAERTIASLKRRVLMPKIVHLKWDIVFRSASSILLAGKINYFTLVIQYFSLV